MEGKQKLDLKILLDKPSFYIDEIITGNLIFQTERSAIIEKIVIEIIFFQKFNTAINTQNAPIICYEKLCCFELDLNPFLSKVEGCYILKGGNTKIPFKIDLKRDLYPCFEFPLKDKYAFLRYRMDINIFSMSFNKTQFSHYIRLLSRPIINDKNKCLNKSISKNLKKWNIINIGTTTLTVSIPDNNCKYDDVYKYEFNDLCYEECPYGTELNIENFVCLYTKISDVFSLRRSCDNNFLLGCIRYTSGRDFKSYNPGYRQVSGDFCC